MSSKNRARPAPANNDRYDQTRSQLQKETAALLAQRRTLEGSVDPRPPTASNVRALLGESPLGQRENEQRTAEVVSKLQEIIRLCREEGELTSEEMQEVVKVETEVLNYLQRNADHPNHPRLRPPTQDTPQADRAEPQTNHTWGKPQSQQQLISNRPLSPQDTLEVIAELERKALGEIIHLQKERDALKLERDQLAQELRRGHGGRLPTGGDSALLEENRLLREENHALQVRLATIGEPSVHRPTVGEDFASRQGLAGQQYSSQIAVYENELKRATVVINELRARLSNVAGLEELHAQGERIRRETAQLLQYKGRGSGEDAAVIQELQERLEQEERGKAQYFEEVRAFKQQLIQIQEENRQLKMGNNPNTSQFPEYSSYSPIAQRPSARGPARKRTGLSDYEKTLNEMRQVMR